MCGCIPFEAGMVPITACHLCFGNDCFEGAPAYCYRERERDVGRQALFGEARDTFLSLVTQTASFLHASFS